MAFKVIRAEGQFQVGTNFQAWVWRIARNELMTGYRRQGREPVSWPEGFNPPAPEGVDVVEVHEVVALMDNLNENQREVLLLIGSGEGYEEAAAALGVSVGTVKSRLWRARELMRRLVDGEPELPAPDPV